MIPTASLTIRYDIAHDTDALAPQLDEIYVTWFDPKTKRARCVSVRAARNFMSLAGALRALSNTLADLWRELERSTLERESETE